MNLVLYSRIFSYKKEEDIYTSDEIVRFDSNSLEKNDLQISIPLVACRIDNNDELILWTQNRAEFISKLLEGETAESQLKIIARAQNSL